MLTCEQTQHLFDAYLDGELSSSLRSEVHTHRLECSGCNHQLALLECCGDVVTGDVREPALAADFTDRLLSEMPLPAMTAPSKGRSTRLYRLFAPMAAAAAAVLVTVLIAPPMKTNAPATHKVAAGEKPAPTVGAAKSVTVIDEQGKVGIVTVVQEKNAAGEVRTASMYKEAPASLAEMMIQGSLVPTARGWDRLRLSNTALQELGRMVLLQSIDGLRNTSTEGQEVAPASEAPAEPAIEQLNVERNAEELLQT